MRAISSLFLMALFATCVVSQGDNDLGPGEWKLVFRQKAPSLGGAWWPRSDLYRYNPTDDTAPLYAILDELVMQRGGALKREKVMKFDRIRYSLSELRNM